MENLASTVAFNESCGLRLRWRSNETDIALFSIGPETPGFLIRRRDQREAGCLWVEEADTKNVATNLKAEGIQTVRIETAMGVNPSGNLIGFSDYTDDLARGHRS